MAHNGIFLLEASNPWPDKDGTEHVSIPVLLVFDVTPFDYDGTRIVPSPLNTSQGWALSPESRLLLQKERPTLITALDGGEAVCHMENYQARLPVNTRVLIKDMGDLWQVMYTKGIHQAVANRFQHAGLWVDVTPPKV